MVYDVGLVECWQYYCELSVNRRTIIQLITLILHMSLIAELLVFRKD